MTDFEQDSSRVPMVHAITADDGWVLRVFDHAPRDWDGPCGGLVIVGHAMMVDARTLERPDRQTITDTLCRMGFRVLVADLRGHGHSGPRAAEGGDWNYDDLVGDVRHLLDLGEEVGDGLPMFLVGHSLFGHVALAHLGQVTESRVRALALLGCEVWLRRNEPSVFHWWLKSLLVWLSGFALRQHGRLPAIRLRMGSNDESRGFWQDLMRTVRSRRWTSNDGDQDYDAGLSTVELPVLHVLSSADKLYARPRSALRWSSVLRRRTAWVLGPDAPALLQGLTPTHMGLITDPRSAPIWRAVGRWLHAQAKVE